MLALPFLAVLLCALVAAENLRSASSAALEAASSSATPEAASSSAALEAASSSAEADKDLKSDKALQGAVSIG
jgi:hypothetical protein